MAERAPNPVSVSKSITAQSTWSDELTIKQLEQIAVSISGTFSATVTLQRKIDGTNWRVVKTYTAAAEETYYADKAGRLRIGVDTGDYTSGTVVVYLGKGD